MVPIKSKIQYERPISAVQHDRGPLATIMPHSEVLAAAAAVPKLVVAIGQWVLNALIISAAFVVLSLLSI